MARPDQPLADVLRLLTAPVTIIGTAVGGRTAGLTASWVMRTSHDPPMLAVSIGHERATHPVLCQAAAFSVSLLREGQVSEARLFGLVSGRERDKWAEVDHVLLEGGVPALADCVARYLCRKVDRIRTGDHDMFFGEVVAAEVVAGPPVLPLRGEDYRPQEA